VGDTNKTKITSEIHGCILNILISGKYRPSIVEIEGSGWAENSGFSRENGGCSPKGLKDPGDPEVEVDLKFPPLHPIYVWCNCCNLH